MEEINIPILESLKILFCSDSGKEDTFRDMILKKYGNCTLTELYNYYVIAEETRNTNLVIKQGNFEF